MFRSRNSDNWSKKIKKVGILFLCFLFLSLHLYLVMMHIQTGVGEIMERGKCDKDMFFFLELRWPNFKKKCLKLIF
jgi:hypothetical protein